MNRIKRITIHVLYACLASSICLKAAEARGSYHYHSGGGHYYSNYDGRWTPYDLSNYGRGGGYAGGGYGSDPLADFYRQQAINSQMAQQGSSPSSFGTSVNAAMMPPSGNGAQSQLPTDFGGAQVKAEIVTVDQGNNVRESFHGSGLFKAAWWKKYKDAWYSLAWKDDWVWNFVDWDTLAVFWNISSGATPAEYEFGNNIILQDGKVYYGTQAVMTTVDYYRQAQILAAKGADQINPKTKVAIPPAAPLLKDWAPLGVFSLVHPDEKFSSALFQIAVNRQGRIKGNYYNISNDQLDAINGYVDKTNSRVCFTVGKSHTTVYDTGLGNLLDAQSPILVHTDKERTEQYDFIRLNQAKL